MNINDNIAAVQAAITANASQRRARPTSDPIFDQLLAQRNTPAPAVAGPPTQPNPIQRRMGATNAGPAVYANNYSGPMDQGNPDTAHIDPVLRDAVMRMIKDSGNTIGINSGYRDNVRQASLYKDALAKYGNAHDAGAWVAPPGSSPHNKGEAVDLNLPNAAAIAYAHANAAKYGLVFPLANENWHIERQGWRK